MNLQGRFIPYLMAHWEKCNLTAEEKLSISLPKTEKSGIEKSGIE